MSIGHNDLIIVLSTVLGFIGIALIISGAIWCVRSRRKPALFNRGITPICDDEIATWKVRSDRKVLEDEPYTARPSHASKDSTSSTRKAQTIQYHHGSRPSADLATSPRSFFSHKYSIDIPQQPEAAVLARAPNARSGLTDEALPGDDPFVSMPRRQPSRLQKAPKNPSRGNSRSRGSRSNSMKSHIDSYRPSMDFPPVDLPELNGNYRGHSRIYSTSSMPPQLSSSSEDNFAGLSPPSRRHETIGQAIG
ncbi:hypothetical protein F5Y16DRAFT_316913 [Xylariaceae sp. FL0255]|nr:hypothetical protein F5Y16DRAFT_316913 [Xylariaceae sp. FL0255]